MLRLVVRTPREVAVEREVDSLRVPARSGQVGLRAGREPLLLAVEPGLVLARSRDALLHVGTAGGLLRCDGRVATLLTPVAVAGEGEHGQDRVREALEAALATPGAELEARAALDHLQASILRELAARHETRTPERSP